MNKTEAIERLERAIAAIKKLPEDFYIADVCAARLHKDAGATIHIDRYQHDGLDEVALTNYAEVAGLAETVIDEENKGEYFWHYATDENGTIIMQLVKNKERNNA